MNCACYEQVDNIFVEVSIELSFLKKRNSYSGTFDKYFPKGQSQRALYCTSCGLINEKRSEINSS